MVTTAASVVLPVAADLPVRLAARFIDVILVMAVTVSIGLVIGFGFDWLLLDSALIVGYFIVLDVVAGATLGKKLLGLRVMGARGGNPTWREAAIREAFILLGSIPFIGPFLALGSWIWISLTIRRSPTHQGKHDELAGGTRVVRVMPAS